ncbi:hypothetical protein LTR56_007501 [Elasticomyces elasticus]|nr:hypothetical protein LTR56_007501 [Elasticomyces elasticus]KAK3668177.1 hypothetical protein LTR22_000862 [Elasticomyces elasticus]KAK4921377.1 hypothetical protein LTR49_011207 [Elasticomyces elasticus]KAK5769496.1 hypothetical protein LTS12_000423 [Elasticomyces elasticus]
MAGRLQLPVPQWTGFSLISSPAPVVSLSDHLAKAETLLGFSPSSVDEGQQVVVHSAYNRKRRTRPSKITNKHRLAIQQRKDTLESIKFGRSVETTARERDWRFEDVQYVRIADFNGPIEALQASMRYQELRAEAYAVSNGETEDPLEGETDGSMERALEIEIEEMMAGLQMIDNIETQSALQERQQRQTKPESISFSFTALIHTLDAGKSSNGEKGKKAVNKAQPVASTNGEGIKGAAETTGVIAKRTGPTTESERKAEARAKYLATLPGPAELYEEGTTSVYYHPGMSFEQAADQISRNVQSAHAATKSWAEQWSPRQFIELARRDKRGLEIMCRDLFWIAEFLHLGRRDWDCALWPRTLFAEMNALLPELQRNLDLLAAHEGCEWLKAAAVEHVKYAFGRFAALAMR